MMSIPVLLGVAYATLAALLLMLCLATPFRRGIKVAAIIFVSGLYIATYIGLQDLRGWALAGNPPNPFKLHWAVIEEPDKSSRTRGGDRGGAIYLLAQGLSAYGALQGAPRLYVLPFSLALAEEVAQALEQLEGGAPLEGTLTYKAIKPNKDEKQNKQTNTRQDLEESAGDDAPSFTFRKLPLSPLPPKK